MKKYLIFIVFVIAGFVFSVNSQSLFNAQILGKSYNSSETSSTSHHSIQDAKNAELLTPVPTIKEKTKKFKVYGNCGMCKKTIEGSLKNVEGVSFAEWDKETGEMTVSFDTKNISLDDVKQRIADVGYDTDSHRAKEEIYNGLPGCCQYDRPNG